MGTDVALMLGIAHTLVENGWQDEAFLARYTTGYDRFADYLWAGPTVRPKQQNGRRKSAAFLRRKFVNWRKYFIITPLC